jgi:ribonucleoside-diphosphate reductase alpha chain
LLNTYKYGWKTSYYQNTYDYKTDGEIAFDDAKQQPVARDEFTGSDEEYEEHCEACAI